MRGGSYRVTIGGTLLVVVVLGVGLAALRSSSPVWASAIYSAAIAAVVFAMLGGIFRRGPARAFWSGFAIVGGIYLVLSCGPWLESTVGNQLVTTAALELFYAAIEPPSPPASMGGMGGGMMSGYGGMGGMPGMPGMGGAGMGMGGPGGMMPGGGGWVGPAVTTANESKLRIQWRIWSQPRHEADHLLIIWNVASLQSSLTYQRIGHSLFALLFGLLGGLTARWFRGKDAEPTA